MKCVECGKSIPTDTERSFMMNQNDKPVCFKCLDKKSELREQIIAERQWSWL